MTCDVFDRVLVIKGAGGFDDGWCRAITAALPGVGVDVFVACRELNNLIDDLTKLRASAGYGREYFVVREPTSERGSSPTVKEGSRIVAQPSLTVGLLPRLVLTRFAIPRVSQMIGLVWRDAVAISIGAMK